MRRDHRTCESPDVALRASVECVPKDGRNREFGKGGAVSEQLEKHRPVVDVAGAKGRTRVPANKSCQFMQSSMKKQLGVRPSDLKTLGDFFDAVIFKMAKPDSFPGTFIKLGAGSLELTP